jgi:uncharacterized protein YqgC (DUF456 family)
MSDTVWTILAAIVMVIGLGGVLIPVLPGLALMWLAALLYGFQVGFGSAGIAAMAALTVLLAVSIATGLILPKRSAQESGAAPWSVWVALVGAIIGFFAIPVVGAIIGALIGMFLAERVDKGDWVEARMSTIGMAKGFGVNTLVQFGIGVIMLTAWSLWAATVLL